MDGWKGTGGVWLLVPSQLGPWHDLAGALSVSEPQMGVSPPTILFLGEAGRVGDSRASL